uniref:Nuclear receptor coactivator 4 n=1 Tax=Eptatretus burgeri TaxID=7764 RepID=A0A8C4N3Y0_EPTBU
TMSKWLEACQVAQHKVAATIADVIGVQKHLRDAGEKVIKHGIKGGVCESHLLECLRSREIWLLSQVELVEQLKDEALQDQMFETYQLQSSFNLTSECWSLCSLTCADKRSDTFLVCHKPFYRYTALNLKADVSRDVAFSADVASLRNAIMGFGSVDCTVHLSSSMEMLDLSDDDFINFDDVGQDNLEKNVDSCTVLPAFYKEMKLSDWLHHKAKLAPQTASAIPLHPVKTTDSHSFLPAYYKDMKMTNWLQQEVKSSSQASPDVHYINKHDCRDWLAPPAANFIQSEACVGCPSASLPTSREKPVEIENLATLHCIGERGGNTVPAGEVHHRQLVPSESLLPQVCRANELCGSFSECVCDGECKRVVLSGWLLQQEGRDKNGILSQNTLTMKRRDQVASRQLNQSDMDPVEVVGPKPDLPSFISSTKGNNVQKVQQSASDHWLFKKQSHVSTSRQAARFFGCHFIKFASLQAIKIESVLWIHRSPLLKYHPPSSRLAW